MSDEYVERVRAAAIEYYNNGWHVTVVPYRTKSKKRDRTFLYRKHESLDALLKEIEEPKNIGISLGYMSNNLVDIDVDDPEIIPYVNAFFPETRTFGRPNHRGSHRFARTTDGPIKSQALNMPGHGTIVEIRGSGNHTIVPPSHHKDTGEAIEWYDPEVVIVEMKRDEIVQCLKYAGAAFVVSRYHIDGSWHFLTRDLVGWFVRNDVEKEFTQTFLHTIERQIFHADDFRDIDNLIDSTYEKWEDGRHDEVTGFPSLTDHIDEKVLKKIGQWLGLRQGADFNLDLPVTDAHNVDRLIARFGQQLLFCSEWKSWLWWNGKVWERDPHGFSVNRCLGDVAKSIYAEAAAAPTQQERQELGRWARISEMWPRIDACTKLARSHERLQVTVEELDADPYTLNTQNGVVNLRTGEMMAHNPELMMTRVTTCKYDPSVDTPVFRLLMDIIFNGDKDMSNFLKRAIGASLMGEPGKFFFACFGETNRGKTTILAKVFERMLGTYAKSVPADAVASRRQREAVMWMAELVGVRYAVLSELPRNFEIDVSLIKAMTGGNKQIGKRLYELPFEFEPSATFWIDTNHLPKIGDSDQALWGRMKPVLFTGLVKKERGEPGYVEDVDDRLRAEFPGILAWAVEGAQEYLENGLMDPPSVINTNKQYQQDEDPIREFVDDVLIIGQDNTAVVSDVNKAFRYWAKDAGVRGYSTRDLTTSLEGMGFEKRQTTLNGVTARYWFGFTLEHQHQQSNGRYHEKSEGEEELTMTPYEGDTD